LHFFPAASFLWRGFFIFAGMKTSFFVIGFFLLAMAACNYSAKVPEPVETPSPELSTIDSLMWHQPDSALALLLEFVASPKADSLDVFNGHYSQLLISELLYKNDYEQSNRPDLLQAVHYFDSLLVLADTRDGTDARRASSQNTTATLAFLDARAHYINGVGYYENDSIVPACAEYLKTLEVMEEHFGEKELVGHKARFMAYTYNRLGDMFSEQFMMEPAIDCYENALIYCRIEPTSPQGVSNILYRLGQQYDMKGEKDKARDYYEKAIEEMTSYNNLNYRDLKALLAFSDYRNGVGMEQPLNALRKIISQTDDISERLTRFLTIGDIFYEQGMYDSAIVYLEPVFYYTENKLLQIQASEFLRIIYDSIGDNEKLDQCLHFLALQKKSEGQNKVLVSQLEDLFKSHMNRKQEKEAEEAQKKSIKKTVGIIVPIAIAAALAIIIIAKLRGKKLLRDKEKRHQEEMESERQTHRMEQAALSGRLKKSNEELRDVSKQLEQSLSRNTSIESDVSNDYSAFVNAPVCLYIVELVHKQQFKSKMDYLIYKDYALSKDQILALRDAAEKHLTRFVSQIRKQFPKLTDSDMDYCYLFLLGLNEADISALMQRAYTTVCDRSRKINRIIEADDSLYHALRNMLNE
jgi:tetratricopeptide (TPR) repeat protein